MVSLPSFSWSSAGRFMVVLAGVFLLMTSLTPASASALKKGDPCPKDQFQFFGLEPWYQYLPYTYNGDPGAQDPTQVGDGHCEIGNANSQDANSQDHVLGKSSYLILILLAVVDDLLRVAGIVAVVFVIIGGFKFITSNGEPEQAASARQSITYALIGLVVALIAVVIVSFIGSTLGT